VISIIVSFIASVGIIFFLLEGLVKNRIKDKKFIYILGALALAYIVSLVLQTLWLFNIYSYADSDFLTLNCMVIVAEAFAFYFFVILFKKNNLTSITLTLYLIGLCLTFLSPLNFALFAMIASFFFMLLLFLNLIDSKQVIIRKISYSILMYAGISIILSFLIALGINLSLAFLTIINLLFLLVAYYLSHHFPDYSAFPGTSAKDKPFFLMFLKYMIFIIAFTNIVLISTLSLHEFGHVLTARYYNCDARAIFFEKGLYPYSEINCGNVSGDVLIALAGLVLPIAIALLLFFIDNSIVRATALLVAGFNLIAGYKDFKEVNLSASIILVFTLFGVLLLLFGLIFLARFVFNQQNKHYQE
jgi:hypothetical protein